MACCSDVLVEVHCNLVAITCLLERVVTSRDGLPWQMDQKAASFSFTHAQISAAFARLLFTRPPCAWQRHFLLSSPALFFGVSAGTRAAPSAAVSATATAMAPRTSVQKSSTPAPHSTPSRARPWDLDETPPLWWAEKKKSVPNSLWQLYGPFFVFFKWMVRVTTNPFARYICSVSLCDFCHKNTPQTSVLSLKGN